MDLVPEAVAAFTDFHQKQLYGPFSQHSLRKAWQRAAKKAGIVHARPGPAPIRDAHGLNDLPPRGERFGAFHLSGVSCS